MLSCAGLRKAFRGPGLLPGSRTSGRTVLEGTTALSLPRGELRALSGRNGVGKTTLLRILAGLLQPDAGRVEIDGRDVTREPQARRRLVSLVHADARSFYGRLSCRENLAFFAALLDLPGGRRGASAAVDRALRDASLEAEADRRYQELSSGTMQRLALARGFLHGADWLLLDEPASELDPVARAAFLERTLRRCRDQGCGVLWVTHRPEELEAAGCRFLVLGPGGSLAHATSASAVRDLLAAGEGA